MIRRIISICLAVVLAAAMVFVSTEPAQARTFCDEAPTYHVKSHTGATHYSAYFDYKWCTKIRKGPDKWWIKPMSAGASYHLTHPALHISQWCFPYGDLDYYVFTFRLTNKKSGLDTKREVKVDCHQDGKNDNFRIITHMPTCTVPVHYDGGRDSTPHRRYCRLSIKVERVMKGPDPNGFDVVVRRHVLRR